MTKVKCDITLMDSGLFLIGWFILMFVTFGLAAPFFLLSFGKYLINRSSLIEDGRYRRMSSNLNIGGDAIYLIIWTVLSIVTFGVAGIFFIFSLGKRILNSITID